MCYLRYVRKKSQYKSLNSYIKEKYLVLIRTRQEMKSSYPVLDSFRTFTTATNQNKI